MILGKAINTLTRRHFLEHAGNFLRAGAITSIGSMLPSGLLAADAPVVLTRNTNRNRDPWFLARIPGTIPKPLVLVFLTGGPSHIDTFDPKPSAPLEYRVDIDSIQTRTPGLRVSELFPKMARNIDDFMIVRSMRTEHLSHNVALAATTSGDSRLINDKGLDLHKTPHFDGGHIKLAEHLSRETGIGLIGLNADRNTELQGAVQNNHRYSMFVHTDFWNGATYRAPIERLRNLPRVEQIQQLRNQFDGDPENRIYGEQGRNVDEMYENLRRVVGMDIPRAFDLNNIPDRIRESLGSGDLENAAIITRNLVKQGVQLIFLNVNNWDAHGRIKTALKDGYEVDEYSFDGERTHAMRVPGLGTRLDNMMHYLREEIGDEAVVAVFGEFGRTPRVNNNAGRDHWGQSYSAVFFGAGINGGVIGRTDNVGAEIVEGPVFLEKTILEKALNEAGYMRVMRTASEDYHRFDTQNW